MPGAADETSAATSVAEGRGGPTNLVVLLLDSLNRHMLGSYGGTEFETPNLDRFARERAVRFTSHVTGSLPCMPARHDILCGTLDFLWRPWGSIEIWEEPITQQLRRAGVTTMLVSDHPHLFEVGGENYHTDFSAWDYVRGHEGDPWRTYSDPSYVGAPALPARSGGWYWSERLGFDSGERPYDRSRTFFRAEEDFPGPRTMRRASEWLRRGAPEVTPFLLFVDEFDPHEPFDTPEPWLGRYDPDWEGELLIWPPYDVGAVAQGRLSEREGRHIRANYGAKLSMIDHWVGEVFSALEERGLWDSTAVIVCTDHGHYLGEKDIWGKPGVMQYEPLGHTPLLVHWPGVAGGAECGALTTNVDIHATIADVFGVTLRGTSHGASLVPLVRGAGAPTREWAIGGVYGNWVQVTDGRRKYARGADGANFPLSMWSNRWSTMTIHGLEDLVRLPPPDRRARLDYLPGSDVPVICQPFEPGDRLPFWVGHNVVDAHFLFDLECDPGEDENRAGTGGTEEADMMELLRVALKDVEAPVEQLETARSRVSGSDAPFVLPRVPASSGALIFDSEGRLLIVNPTYKTKWTIPGGIMEADGETPWECCRREVREEVALDVTHGRLVAVDFLRPKSSNAGGIRFLFDCGVFSDDALAGIELQEEELSEYLASEPARALELLSGPLSRRVGAVLAATDCVYLEDGRPV